MRYKVRVGSRGIDLGCKSTNHILIVRSARQDARASQAAQLADAREIIAAWRDGYNQQRLYSGLGYLTPADFAQRLPTTEFSLTATG